MKTFRFKEGEEVRVMFFLFPDANIDPEETMVATILKVNPHLHFVNKLDLEADYLGMAADGQEFGFLDCQLRKMDAIEEPEVMVSRKSYEEEMAIPMLVIKNPRTMQSIVFSKGKV